MNALRVSLFGKLEILCDGQPLVGLDYRKAQDLFCYLLLHRNRPHPRETLAGLLWGECSTSHSKKYLRQALWQLNSALETHLNGSSAGLLIVEPDWIALNAAPGLWLDVAALEDACAQVQNVSGAQLSGPEAEQLQMAVELYRGDLLEGWYADWTLFERERLQNLYLTALDKLVAYCEQHDEFERGLQYSAAILRIDRAHERTHRRLMRLYYHSGDRSNALRQYDRCVDALKQELGVEPSGRTAELYQQIRGDHIAAPVPNPTPIRAPQDVPALLRHLQQMHAALAYFQAQMQQDLKTIEHALVSNRESLKK